MIFVLLGIIILIASFLIALASLVREQAKFERGAQSQGKPETETLSRRSGSDAGGGEVPMAAGTTLAQSDLPNLGQTSQVGIQDDGQKDQENEQKYDTSGAPFWERLGQNDSMWGENAQSQQSIEQIRAEIHRMTQAKKNETQENLQKPDAKKLSGEFSIDQLTRSNS